MKAGPGEQAASGPWLFAYNQGSANAQVRQLGKSLSKEMGRLVSRGLGGWPKTQSTDGDAIAERPSTGLGAKWDMPGSRTLGKDLRWSGSPMEEGALKMDLASFGSLTHLPVEGRRI